MNPQNSSSELRQSLELLRPYFKRAFWFSIVANNMVGDMTAYAAPAVGYPHMRADSLPSQTVSVTSN